MRHTPSRTKICIFAFALFDENMSHNQTECQSNANLRASMDGSESPEPRRRRAGRSGRLFHADTERTWRSRSRSPIRGPQADLLNSRASNDLASSTQASARRRRRVSSIIRRASWVIILLLRALGLTIPLVILSTQTATTSGSINTSTTRLLVPTSTSWYEPLEANRLTTFNDSVFYS